MRFNQKRTMAAVLFSIVFLFSLTGNASDLLSYQAPETTQSSACVLYFRYLDSAYLGQETRLINIPLTDSPEKALIENLLQGPGSQSPFFKALFPKGTEVLSVSDEKNQLFVLFNAHLLDPYPGENLQSDLYRQGEGHLKRRLAMASLVNTLTESGTYHSVQVLVQETATATGSLRLNMRYYLEGSDLLPDPLTRQEEMIITPGIAAEAILSMWKTQSWNDLRRHLYIASNDSQTEDPLPQFKNAPALIKIETTSGSISPDGSYAVVTVSLQVMDRLGMERAILNYPLVLQKQDNIWKARSSCVLALMEASQ